MPRCEGLPSGRCPDNKNDSSVKLGEGDLMLCPRCDSERSRSFLEARQSATVVTFGSGVENVSGADRHLPSGVKADDGADTAAVSIPKNGIIVNELLCYVFNKIDILPVEELANIVARFYDDTEIMSSLVILKDVVNGIASTATRRRLPKRIGKDKILKSVEDICTLMHDFSAISVDAPAASLPSFVAFRLSRMPAVDTSHLDVTTLSQQIRELRLEVNTVKSSVVMKDELTSMNNLLLESTSALSQQIQQLKPLGFAADSLSPSAGSDPDTIQELLANVTVQLCTLTSRVDSLSSRLPLPANNWIHLQNDKSTVSQTDGDLDCAPAVHEPIIVSAPSLPNHSARQSVGVINSQAGSLPTDSDVSVEITDRYNSKSELDYVPVVHEPTIVSAPSLPDHSARQSVGISTSQAGSLSTDSNIPVEITDRYSSKSESNVVTDGDDYHLVQRRRSWKKKKQPLIGSRSVPVHLQSLQPVLRERSLFITRLPPTATTDDLCDYIAETFQLRASCSKILSGRFHSSFKVIVTTAHPRMLYDSSYWPNGVLVRHYYDRNGV